MRATQFMRVVGAKTASPLPENQIRVANVDVKSACYRELPGDYQRFLAETNGAAWNGLSLYGIYPEHRHEEDSAIPDIVAQNERFANLGGPSRVILGHVDEQLLAYDERHGYQRLDMFTHAPLAKFATLDQLVKECLDRLL